MTVARNGNNRLLEEVEGAAGEVFRDCLDYLAFFNEASNFCSEAVNSFLTGVGAAIGEIKKTYHSAAERLQAFAVLYETINSFENLVNCTKSYIEAERAGNEAEWQKYTDAVKDYETGITNINEPGWRSSVTNWLVAAGKLLGMAIGAACGIYAGFIAGGVAAAVIPGVGNIAGAIAGGLAGSVVPDVGGILPGAIAGGVAAAVVPGVGTIMAAIAGGSFGAVMGAIKGEGIGGAIAGSAAVFLLGPGPTVKSRLFAPGVEQKTDLPGERNNNNPALR